MHRTLYEPNRELLAAVLPDIKDGPAPLTVRFDNVSCGDLAAARWNFGDGQTSAHLVSVSHTYTAPGLYRVVLIVTDRFGNTDTDDAETITVGEGPWPTF